MRITVVIPAFNAADTIGDAVASVLAQSHHPLDIVVVDDGSSDATAAVVRRHTDPRVRLIGQAHAGVSHARNAGMQAAAGDALLFLDADDWLAPHALASLAAALAARPDAVAAVGAVCVVVEGQHLQSRPTGRIRPVPAALTHDPLPALLVRNLLVNGGHVLIDRNAARAVGPFHTGLAFGEDWDYWVRLALLGRFAAVADEDPLLFVRSRADGAYRRLATQPEAFAACVAAVFDSPALVERFGRARLARLRRQAEAENAWIIGRELVRRGEAAAGRRWLRRSVAASPGARRLLLLCAAHCLGILPLHRRGPFVPYPEPAATLANAP